MAFTPSPSVDPSTPRLKPSDRNFAYCPTPRTVIALSSERLTMISSSSGKKTNTAKTRASGNASDNGVADPGEEPAFAAAAWKARRVMACSLHKDAGGRTRAQRHADLLADLEARHVVGARLRYLDRAAAGKPQLIDQRRTDRQHHLHLRIERLPDRGADCQMLGPRCHHHRAVARAGRRAFQRQPPAIRTLHHEAALSVI